MSKILEQFFQKYVKPVIDGSNPDAVQNAIFDNHIGQYAVCDCNRAIRNCSKYGEVALAECGGKFRYIIAGRYEVGEVPEKMTMIDIPDGEWIKFHFDGGMPGFQKIYQLVFSRWIPNQMEIAGNTDMIVEWYDGEDITSPDFKCGIMLHIKSIESHHAVILNPE